MSRIKAKNTRPEMAVRSLLHRMGYRFRLHAKNLPGCPDIVLPNIKPQARLRSCFAICVYNPANGIERTNELQDVARPCVGIEN
jgi:DNA mismatch endonuclease Vsr